MDLKALVPWRNDTRSQPPAVRGDVLDSFDAFRREVDRMFDSFFDGFGSAGRASLAGWSKPTPTMDVDENDKEIVITAELPGLDNKDFEVTVAGDVLTVKGEKKSEHEQRNGDSYYAERRFGAFSRSVRLPFEVNDEAIDAKYEKGLLTVRVPKPADVQRSVRRIEVKTA